MSFLKATFESSLITDLSLCLLALEHRVTGDLLGCLSMHRVIGNISKRASNSATLSLSNYGFADLSLFCLLCQ